MRRITTPKDVLSSRRADPTGTPLCVDLDGTLIRTDSLHENFLLLLKHDPWGVVCALAVLLRHGIAAFKRSVASRAGLPADLLPYHPDVLAYVTAEAARGRRILLVTAADRLVADAVAEHLGIFEAVLASDGVVNLKGRAKAEAICRRLGDEPFEYLGDSISDLPVWQAAAAASVVAASRRATHRLERAGVRIAHEFRTRPHWRLVARAMRPYQWCKNILVFAPLFLSHKVFETARLIPTIEAFAAFCAAASAIYVMNDLLDLQVDRQHPRKRFRPFAAGTLTVVHGVALIIILLAVCAGLCLRMPPLAALLMALYVATSLIYGLYAKTHLFLDVITLAGLYSLRLLFGGDVAGVVISPWTLGFSIFFFTSLACCKRLAELRAADADAGRPLPGRAYFQSDVLSMTSLASSSGYAAVLVMALYLNSPDFAVLYRRPRMMWTLVPLVAYWISRTIMVTNRGEMRDDPIVFAFGDRASQVVGLAALAVILVSL